MLSLDAELEKEVENDDLRLTIEPGYEADFISQALFNDFCEELNDTDTNIFYMRIESRTYEQIAAKLGCKTHSAVSKRAEKIRQLWPEFSKEIKSK